jgi:hypothetical protein
MRRKYAIKNNWMNSKTGTRRNLILRILCLKSNIPAKAPNGPKNATNRSLDSEILHPPLKLLNLSTPKKISETTFKIPRKTSKGVTWTMFIILSKEHWERFNITALHKECVPVVGIPISERVGKSVLAGALQILNYRDIGSSAR